ncbi:ABC transporter permease [Candidatus Nomurabacteria bacterium]|uniref:ABC transporter permease n=1 Tax=candidate division WWE3 bacterium TaxID=2053526 RepID=A0A955IWJ5_UNCKA|nr:ABC transporter permease [candidate division WWE3 bacterium]MCB9824028.1 ABC transporter permease [Candidatus Nomurabacteria bacterium]MCB9827001.1 ABC transporter permease [Candidatus Nomurabacteria bacterium]MCB9827969.1 ABC transporter permease [Candidatus Nomurabacteria bacterium]HXK52808.1 ABC transporter permease [bacterium]
MSSKRLVEALKTSITALKANKIRTFLTTLGVIIGVFSVVSLVSLGKGAQNYIEDQFNAIGSNLIFVSPGKVDLSDDPAKFFSKNKLAEKHVKLIENALGDKVVAVTPSIRVGQTVQYKTKSFYPTVIGANEQLLLAFDFNVDQGRAFNSSAVSSKSRVAVLGKNVAQELFAGIDPIDKKIKIGKDTFKVVAVLSEKNRNFDDNVYIPYTTAKEVFDVRNFSSIGIKVKDSTQVKAVMREVELTLLKDLKKDDFSVLSQQDILSTIQNVLNILTLGIGAIAGISLVVGGIGIMNIMLVSVTERIREIGLRKALGATSFDIGLQFVIESILLSIIGGLVGLAMGAAVALAARSAVRTEVPFSTVVLAFTFSLVVGVVFGTYPALQASKKDPIEALRYE